MSDLFDLPAPVAAHRLRDLIATGACLTRTDLNTAMRLAHGSDADGDWSQRDSFEALEHALALHLRTMPVSGLDDVAAVSALMQRLPIHTVRSERQIDLQQFSTPADIAALAVAFAAIGPDDIVLEPSAGNGLLVAQLPGCAALQLNEIDPPRRARLADIFPGAHLSDHDGAALVAHHAHLARPSVVLMNPPFSRGAGGVEDPLAAERHLLAALRRLRPGGRAVAIMPDRFTPSPRMRATWDKVLAGMHVATALRLDGCYARHGTGIAVRLYVIDKIAGDLRPVVIEQDTVAAFLPDLHVPPRADMPGEPTSAAVASAPGRSLFGAARTVRPASGRTLRAAVRNEVLPVAYAALDTPAALGEQVGVYLPYRPSRIRFETAGEHPTALVESVAMGSIPAPVPTHIPHLPERIVTERLLSSSQLETVVYAGHAWSQFLPGTFRVAEKGVALTLDAGGRSYRKGFFLDDGTGAGKGRQVAACILDNWLAGRRRHIWVTKNEPLLEDARRDWTALGGMGGDVVPLSTWKIDGRITLEEGVLFVTYPMLRSGRGDATRLRQIVEWAGPDFDGVIAFDEAHEMGGVAGGEGAMFAREGSQQGICGVLLQHHLPDARVLYASATGASEVNNLAYAVRLGLWGPETAFADRESFIAEIRQGGIAAMELVARDLKALGLYTARALSFAGVEYDVLRHELTSAQIEIYDAFADAWGILCAAWHKTPYREEAVM